MATTYICSLPNIKAPGRFPQLITDDLERIKQFVEQWDRPGRAIYECVSPLRDYATRRALETVEALVMVHVDIDLRTLATPEDAVLAKLKQLPLRPEVRHSGGGFHVVWQFKEAIPAKTADFDRANELRSRLTALLCGDPAPNHAAALLRKVGTHNSKYGEPRLVRILQEAPPVDLIELEELADTVGDTPLFTALPKGNGHSHAEEGPRTERKPIDIEQRLAAMAHKGPGDSAVHQTQLQTTASMLRAGQGVDDVVAEVLEATRKAVGNDPEWNWRAEQYHIEEMCFSFIGKNPELAILLPDKLREAWEARLAEGRTDLKIIHSRHIGWHVRSWDNHTAQGSSQKLQSKDKPGDDEGAAPKINHTAKARGWNFYDSTETTPTRWLIKGLLPETGVGILAGQWGSFKTTAALDISLSVMTGVAFAGQYRVKRKGAVLYFAIEGAGTLKARLEAIARYRGAPEKLPFAWRGECPLLTARDAGPNIVKCVDEAAQYFEHAYGVPITLIWVDTYVTAAGLSSSGDDNDVAATQKAFTALRFVAAHSGAFVAVVDHYGKVLEAGTRGSSGKEGSADTVLATLADRELTGATSSTRMAARKQRDGISGFELPFTPEKVDLGLDDDGDPVTAIVLDWGKPRDEVPKAGRKSKAVKLLCHALADTAANKGFLFQPDPGGLSVQACHRADLLAAFSERYHAEGTPKQKYDKRLAAYKRAMDGAVAAGLVGVRDGPQGEIIYAKR